MPVTFLDKCFLFLSSTTFALGFRVSPLPVGLPVWCPSLHGSLSKNEGMGKGESI